MAHWAELDDNNKVIRVLVGDNNDPAGDEGYSWLIDNLGGKWVKTSYNATIRGNFAGIGYSYWEEEDVFMPPKCHPEAIVIEPHWKWHCIDPEHELNNALIK